MERKGRGLDASTGDELLADGHSIVFSIFALGSSQEEFCDVAMPT